MVVLLVYFRKIKYGDSPSSWLFNVRSQSNSPQHQFAGENQRSGQKLPSRSYYVTKQMDKSQSTPRNKQITDEENFESIA